MQKYTRKCTDCGGGVTSHHATFKVELPKYEYDELGRPTQIDGVRSVTCQGLGTWSCNGAGCKPCRVSTTVSAA